jgi:hypothetical protein
MGIRNLKQRLYKEMSEYLVILLYLWAVFAMFALYKSVVLAQYRIDVVSQSFAIVNAFALGKVMLIAKKLRVGDVSAGPLIYPTLLKSAIFSVILGCFKILEAAAVGLYHGKSLAEGIAEVGDGTWQGVLSLMAILFVVLIPFFAFTELQRVLGQGKLKQVFFHRHGELHLSEGSSGTAVSA